VSLPALILYVVLPLQGVSLVLAFVRLLIGPSLPDRVVALDLMTSLLIGMLVALALYDDESALMDVALILALVGFLGTVAFARYVEIRGWPGKKS
jgi:multicomponent Na+:H+ antiporter subunit F